jgi:hypothetical protein
MPLTVGIHGMVELIASLTFMLGVNLELMLLFVNLVGYARIVVVNLHCNILAGYIACWINVLLYIAGSIY